MDIPNGFCLVFVALPTLPAVATEAVVLAPSIPPGQEQDGSSGVDLAEFSISRVINRQFSGQCCRRDGIVLVLAAIVK